MKGRDEKEENLIEINLIIKNLHLIRNVKQISFYLIAFQETERIEMKLELPFVVDEEFWVESSHRLTFPHLVCLFCKSEEVEDR